MAGEPNGARPLTLRHEKEYHDLPFGPTGNGQIGALIDYQARRQGLPSVVPDIANHALWSNTLEACRVGVIHSALHSSRRWEEVV